MSARPIEQKQRRKLQKLLRRSLPAYFDLVEWLVQNGHARTKRAARALILAEKVKVDSHVIGIRRNALVRKPLSFGGWVEKQEDTVAPHVPVDQRGRITVLS